MFAKKRPKTAVIPERPRILLWTLWRSGTHWLAGMLAEMTGLGPWYRAAPQADYAQETMHQIRFWPPAGLLVRHICQPPGPLLEAAEAFGFQTILLYRDPRDVLASQVNMRKHVEGFRRGMPPFPDMSIHDILRWELDVYGPFYRSMLPDWVRAEHPLLHKVRYEDLSADIAAELRRIDAFLGCALPAPLLAAIADRHGFERQTRRRRGDEYKGAHNRKGIIGDYRNQFSQAEQALIRDTLGDSLQTTGYRITARPSGADR